MSKGRKIPGFCYVTGKQLLMTAAEWRASYPPSTHRRQVLDGDTLYRLWQPNGRNRLAAEAYAVIPEER